MEIRFLFERNKPLAELFGTETPERAVAHYAETLEGEFRERYPYADVTVISREGVPGDVEFEPADALTSEERLATAVEMKRIAHRLADEMVAAGFSGGGGEALESGS